MHPVKPAAVAAAGVFAFLLAQSLLYRVIRTAQTFAYWSDFSTSNLARIWVDELPLAVGAPLFFSVGVFVGFWRLGPIVGGLRLRQLAARVLLATAVGAACTWLPRFLFGLAFATTVPGFRVEPALLGGVAFDAAMDSLGTLVTLLPLVGLAAVLLWRWLQRNPPTTSLADPPDEV